MLRGSEMKAINRNRSAAPSSTGTTLDIGQRWHGTSVRACRVPQIRDDRLFGKLFSLAMRQGDRNTGPADRVHRVFLFRGARAPHGIGKPVGQNPPFLRRAVIVFPGPDIAGRAGEVDGEAFLRRREPYRENRR